jgi:hypothetical protein
MAPDRALAHFWYYPTTLLATLVVMGDRSGRVGAPARLAHTVRTRKAQATEQIATVELEKLLDISSRAGNAAPVAPVAPDEVEIIREAPPKKFADSSAVGKPALAVPVPVYEDPVPIHEEPEEDDLAIPIELAPTVQLSAVDPALLPPVEAAPAAAPSRRLWWLTLLVALIASGVIAARMFGL